MVGSAMLGPGLVRVVCALPGLFRSSLQSPGQEKHFGILFFPLCVVTAVCRDIVEEIMTDQAWFRLFSYSSVHRLAF